MKIEFTLALKSNIKRTYTYAYVKNTGLFTNSASSYEPIAFFERLLKSDNPFKVFMRLDGYAYKRAKNDLDRYKIPYTERQEHQARLYMEVTGQMNAQRRDIIARHEQDLEGTGIVLYKEPYYLTTEETIYAHNEIKQLPRQKQTDNVIYDHKVPTTLKNAPEQYQALKTCLTNHISCLIGGAGTGKSFVTANIIKQLQENDKEVAVLAPTHKAREALQDKLNGEAQVRTIHSFVHGEKVACDAIVIDESGMLSTPLFAALMEVYDKQQLVFIGDKNQLPPIEYGRPFEKIQEQFVVAELKENKRSEAADIIALGREILGIPQNANMSMPNIEVVGTSAEAFARGAQVALCFKNDSVKQINEEQRIKNGEEAIAKGFSVGDIIIAKTNDRDRHFYNGQLFTLTAFDKAKNNKSSQIVQLKDWKDLLNNFDLAYGLTIHKSQGSEWDIVAYQPCDIDTQNLAYVAVTRAKKKLIIIGNDIKTEYKTDKTWRQLE